MTQCSRPCLVADSLSYEIETGKTLFKQISASVFSGDRIALIGKNGTGKSTLLQIFSGQLSPTTGVVSRPVPSVYVPQASQLNSNQIKGTDKEHTVFDILSCASETWWEIEHLLETTFHTSLDLSLPANSLSGGELMQLSLALALWRSPNLLLLDEPTNHLDLLSLENLRNALNKFEGALVIVSHKPHFLNQVAQTTWELTPTGLQVYGGNYSLYKEQKAQTIDARVRSHQAAKKELSRSKATAQREQKRAAKSSRNASQYIKHNRETRGAANTLKGWAEKAAGKQKSKQAGAIATTAQKVAETKVRSHKVTSIQLSARSQKKRTLIDLRDVNLWAGNRELLKDINFRVESGDRIALLGANGSGKSSLMKAILHPRASICLEGGEKRIAQMKTVYLDQQYALVDREKTVLENMHYVNPEVPYQLLRQQLGHFLFFNQTVHKKASVLSGGELARCAIAMITLSELDLLILDEPTNNLDLETVDQIVNGLNQYTGALIAISHDLDFLKRINVEKLLEIDQNILAQKIKSPTAITSV